MEYAIYIKTGSFTYNIWFIDNETVKSVVESYLEGNTSFFIKGTKYWISNLFEIKIYELESIEKTKEILDYYEKEGIYIAGRFTKGKVLMPKYLQHHFKDVTTTFFPDHFPSDKKEKRKKIIKSKIDLSRILIIHGNEAKMLEYTARFIKKLKKSKSMQKLL